MHASKPRVSVTERHLSAPPAMPTARQPAAFANWPTTLPTAPLAALTTTVSPVFGAMILLSPSHAVTPGMPTGPRYVESGIWVSSTLRKPLPSDVPNSCQPYDPTTLSPIANFGFSDSTTSPTVPPIITSLSGCDAAYDFESSIRPRMYGSSERK